MLPKQLVLDAMMNKTTERTPWVPFVGCHSAFLLGVSAKDYFNNADLIVKGAKKAFDLYRPDGLPVLFDLQVEAEAMGCGVDYKPGNPPAVVTHPLEMGKTLTDLKIPTEKDGRYPIVLDAMRRLCADLGPTIAMYGLVTGPFTLALHLRGADIFYDMADDPDQVKQLMKLCEDVCVATSRMYIEAGCDIVAIVDPMVSQISPRDFEEFCTPASQAIFKAIHDAGKLGSFFVCGNAKRNIEKMAQCGCDNISFDENIPLEYVKEVASKYGVSVGGNMRLTVCMLFGTPMDNIEEARNCIAKGGNTGYILSPGCDMPFSTPVENVQAVAAVVFGEDASFIGHAGGLDGIEVTIPDYASENQVILDIITLDSESCAPCQYTMEAIYTAVEPLGDAVRVIEHKVKEKKEVVFMLKMGASYIPTIIIDGVIEYVSLIPSPQELRMKVEEKIAKKRG